MIKRKSPFTLTPYIGVIPICLHIPEEVCAQVTKENMMRQTIVWGIIQSITIFTTDSFTSVSPDLPMTKNLMKSIVTCLIMACNCFIEFAHTFCKTFARHNETILFLNTSTSILAFFPYTCYTSYTCYILFWLAILRISHSMSLLHTHFL